MKKIIFIILFIIVIITGYGFLINTSGFKIVDQNINITNLPDSFNDFKIAQISDLLIKDKNDLDRIKKIVNSINDRNPDIIVFTGDLLNKKNNLTSDDKNNLIDILNKLECNLYKYAVFGDNDLSLKEDFINIMNNTSFQILDNQSTYLFYKDITPLKITGITNTNDIDKTFEIDDKETFFNLVLTHYPDNVLAINDKDIQVVLAGHSLKGQIVIPFYGGLIKKDGARSYINNYYEVNGKKLFISGGIGTENINFRLFNKPEINIYTLQKK